ncbi:hypothetical protein PABY_08910 [Pyrodictium abyssi]|uniref:AAA+ ATPase domain-containing protein n=2 Tax=Pyrodictium abyssi TaxID=54256 RepID=A0ABN6ZM75_9CREN|nr:hypothetical protein PABY_08910 [Pyrodictium abyssi]
MVLIVWGNQADYLVATTAVAAIMALVSKSLVIAAIAVIYNILLGLYSALLPLPAFLHNMSSVTVVYPKLSYTVLAILVAILVSGTILVARMFSLLRSRPFVDTFLRNLMYTLARDTIRYSLCSTRRRAALSLLLSSVIVYYILLYTYPPRYINDMLYYLLLSASLLLTIPAMIVSSFDKSAAAALVPVLAAAVVLPQPLLLAALVSVIPAETLHSTLRIALRDGYRIGSLDAILVYMPTIRYNIAGSVTISATRTWWSPAYPPVEYRVKTSIDENPHILVTGTTGSGKSFTAMKLAASILEEKQKRNGPILVVIDPHGEYADMFRGKPGIKIVDASEEAPNPLELVGQSPRERTLELVELVSEFYRLGPIQSRILEEAILLSYENAGIRDDDPLSWSNPPPTIRDVVRILEDMSKRDPRASVLAMYISSLASKAFSKSRHVSFPVPGAGTHAVIFDLSRLSTREQMVLYTETILYKLYYLVKKLGPSSDLRYILLIDEAHLFARKTSRRRQIISLIAAELRKYGVMLIVVTQKASELDKTIIANIGTFICLKHTDSNESKFMAETVSRNPVDDSRDALAYTIATLPKGYIVVGDVGLDTPLLVRLG